jgi:putative transposase
VKRYGLTERQWAVPRDPVPGKAGDPGRTALDKKVFVDGGLWVRRSGARWADRPPRQGANWKGVPRRFCRWAHAGGSARLCLASSRAPDKECRHKARNPIKRLGRRLKRFRRIARATTDGRCTPSPPSNSSPPSNGFPGRRSGLVPRICG